jgi:hypothetical protein
MWPFKRKPVHVGPTAVDWKPGDMAECVENNGFHVEYGPVIDIGAKLMVRDVYYDVALDESNKQFFLKFVGIPNIGYGSRCFRKITLTDTGADRTVAKSRPRTPVPAGIQGSDV